MGEMMNSFTEAPSLLASSPVLPLPRFSRLGAALAVCVIALCVVFVVRMQSVHHAGDESVVRPNRMLELMARYAVGVKALLQSVEKSTAGAGIAPADLTQEVLRDMTGFSRTDADALRLLILKGWLMGAWPAAAEFDAIAAKHAALREDVTTLKNLKVMNGEVQDEAWGKLQERHGWIADLAMALAQPAQGAARQAVVQQGMGTALVLIGVSMLGMIAALGGFVVMILGIMRWRSGKLRLTLALPSREHGGVLLEGFAIYLSAFLFLPWLLRQLAVPLPRWAAYGPALIALILGMTWPLLRGMQRASWREALGLHRGQGVMREMGVGVLAWLATLPLLVLGMIAASWIMKITGSFPVHPIMDDFASNGWTKFGAILLAAVWAPVSEEIMFRGLLFPGLSVWLRWLAGLLLSAFVFAAIHPQGWAGVPAIMALAGSFSFLRLWRQSLIAPMTAHALNNGIMCVVLLLLW
jgi:membrane protease YdiL (CAAX protease family)